MATTIDRDLVVPGLIYANGGFANLLRSNFSQESYSDFEIPLFGARIWDTPQTPLTTPAISDDDLGFASGAYATGTPYISAGSLGSVGLKTRFARFLKQVPYEYVAGQPARLNFLAGITGGTPAVASVLCTLLATAYKVGSNTFISGSNIVSTSATSINSTTFADTNFDLTVTALQPGDWLDILVTIACNDATASAANCVPAFSRFKLQCATKG